MANQASLFPPFLEQHDDAAWRRVVAELTPAIHPVDQRATAIWFAFFPVKLHRALAAAPNSAETAKKLILKGRYRLAEQVDTAAEFLYGHRHWPAVKQAVAAYVAATSEPARNSMAEHIRAVTGRAAARLKVEPALLIGITAVAFGTLQQVGYELFKQPAAPGVYGAQWKKTPDRIVAERARDDSQGLFGFLKTVDKEFSVTFREPEPGHSFKVINSQDLTMAATQDKRDYRARDPRCKDGEGPIPVECRTASCGTCWVGVLSPTEKISPPNQREAERWRYFGYEGFTREPDSPIRLACQMKAFGNVTVVIPPWCGTIGKLDGKEETAAAAGAAYSGFQLSETL